MERNEKIRVNFFFIWNEKSKMVAELNAATKFCLFPFFDLNNSSFLFSTLALIDDFNDDCVTIKSLPDKFSFDHHVCILFGNNYKPHSATSNIQRTLQLFKMRACGFFLFTCHIF